MSSSLTHLALSGLLATSALAVPTFKARALNPLEDVLFMDGLAYQDPNSPEQTLASLQSFVYVRQVDLGPVESLIVDGLEGLGLDVGDQKDSVLDKVSLFAAIGLGGKELNVTLNGCSPTSASLGETAGLGSDLGVVANDALPLGECGIDNVIQASTEAEGFFNPRTYTARIFPSGPDGFGVISDIDDTIKVSHVLDKTALVKATFLEDPVAVTGMPELYGSLASSLSNPQFVYISGSPYQLYPLLNSFISSSFAEEAQGPIFLKNLTLTDIGSIVDFVGGGEATLNYKLDQITRIQAMYPKKTFLAIGDSTEKDPEIYAEAYAKFGDFIQCIWIRKVDDAENGDERFATAFADVPSEKIRTFVDADIADLQSIDVAGGQC